MAEQNNTAIGLGGISFDENYNRRDDIYWCVDFRLSTNNYKENLLNNSPADCYISTYNHSLINELSDAWNPQEYILINDYDYIQDKLKAKKLHLLNVCRLIINAQNARGKPYDKVILTRFDLKYNINLVNLPVNTDCLNISAKCEQDHLIDDNIYIMHGSKLNKFYEVVNAWNESFHNLIYMFQKNFTVNFLQQGNYCVSRNPLFTIVRSPPVIPSAVVRKVDSAQPTNLPEIIVSIWGDSDNIIDAIEYFNKHVIDPLFLTHKIIATVTTNNFEQSQITNTCKSILLFSFIKNKDCVNKINESIISHQSYGTNVLTKDKLFVFLNISSIKDYSSEIFDSIQNYKSTSLLKVANSSEISTMPYCILDENTVDKLYL